MRAADAARSIRKAAKAGLKESVIARVARTETAQAFNTGIVEEAKSIEADSGIELEKVWSTEGPKPCPTCQQLDGTSVGLNEDFPQGEPGSIHPNCACVTEIRVASTSRRVIKPRPARTHEYTPQTPAPGYAKEQPTDLKARAYERMLRSDVVPQQLRQDRRTKEFRALLGGIDENKLDFLRSGYRAKLNPYIGASGAEINRIATGAAIPEGSKRPLPPIVINIFPKSERFRTPGAIAQLQDGRHRLEAAQAAGATEIRATIRLYDSELNTVWESDRIIPVPRPDLTNPHERMN